MARKAPEFCCKKFSEMVSAGFLHRPNWNGPWTIIFTRCWELKIEATSHCPWCGANIEGVRI